MADAKFYKGDVVLVAANACLWRRATEAEREAWYADKRKATEEARANGEDTFYINFDSAGEPRIAPRDTTRPGPHAGEFVVVKGRARTKRGYYDAAGCVLLRDADGNEWYTYRKNVGVVKAANPGRAAKAKAKAKAARTGLDADIEAWVAKVNDKFDNGTRKIEWGRKYARVVAERGGVYCFVARENGDILKAANWKAPAKHARGNIYDADPLAGVGEYGAVYLR